MPSLRQKVTTYFRQLSFIAETRDAPLHSRKSETEEGENFITKYLEGRLQRNFAPGPKIYSGKTPPDLPDLEIGPYVTGPFSITAACTGPDDGLTGIKRSKLHLSVTYADDIDFIDTIQESDCFEIRHSIKTSTSKVGSLNRLGQNKLSRSNTPRKTASDRNANTPLGNGATGGSVGSRRNSRTNITYKNECSGSTVKNSNKEETICTISMVSSKAIPVTNPINHITNQNVLNAKKTDHDAAIRSPTMKEEIKSGNGYMESAPSKLLNNVTNRLPCKTNCNPLSVTKDLKGDILIETKADVVASVTNWKMDSDSAYGLSVSLYENSMLTKEPMGHPIADCYGIVVHGDSAVLALADGVNWGDGARLAARSAVHGCLDYLDRAIFGMTQECMAKTTKDVFVSLLRSMWEGHGCILEVGGALSTLTIAVVLPISCNADGKQILKANEERYVVCACNVGDSLGYVYSKKNGVREFTEASHDISSMRDIRDALGALGPADGNKPELRNLTLSMTIIDKGDIVFLTSDGISDNFDPVVGKFAEAWTSDNKLISSGHQDTNRGYTLPPKRQNQSASAVYSHLNKCNKINSQQSSGSLRPTLIKKPSSSEIMSPHRVNLAPSRPKYMRSHTVIDPQCVAKERNANSRSARHAAPNEIFSPKIPKSASGLPLVTGPQRHALTLYRLEDLISYGINGEFIPYISARRLCHLLIDFVRMITSARRKTLEQRELFYKLVTGPDGVKREVKLNMSQHRAARKRVVESSTFLALPGKLDHATVVAYAVGNENKNDQSLQLTKIGVNSGTLHFKEFVETDF